ncbi:xaa-Pro aminopeptidase 2 [Protopterus annectens]|uniref:xaa-Pro aminopeptidase 2 n=1 Tax=Protopterus annectens TaxID=7888 RepID=UPI001CFA8546|nr:xaa-Pro aminopeptidase 2 [Protopterus annectens]
MWLIFQWTLTLLLFSQMECRPTQSKSERQDIRNCISVPPYLPITATNTTRQLKGLQDAMNKYSIGAYIIPATDYHLTAYIAERDARLTFMTGFTGSAGTAVVTHDKAVLFTDSRYWVQAERELDCNWDLERQPWVSNIVEWITRTVPEGQIIGADPFTFSIDDWESYYSQLNKVKRNLTSIEENLVDIVWGSARPPPPTNDIYILPNNVIGMSWQKKVAFIREEMEKKGATAVLLSALDETAWLFNLRGDDIPYNPFFYSYTLLTLDSIRLFMNQSRVSNDVHNYLNATSRENGVLLMDYGLVKQEVIDYIKKDNVQVWIGTEYTTRGLYEVIPDTKLIKDSYSPVMMAKAIKDETEQKILRECHVRDAVALIQYLLWLEKNVPKGTVDEISGASYVDQLRSKQKYSKGPSFSTISASGLNAALAHYSPNNETKRTLRVDEMYLIDSGGQYLDGTTDITRTVHWGTPTVFQKEAYTRVLMGNIDLSRLIFPAGTSGRNMEIIARRTLWDVGLNYGHGTGHGIGNFLCIHEWPVGFQSNNINMQKGMFTSIEPGYYHDNEFGIRIEDVVLVVDADVKYNFSEQSYLRFETISLVPYNRRLIDTSIMRREQVDYLNQYYKKIRDLVGPELQNQKLTEEHDWMMKQTEPFHNNAVMTNISVILLLIVTMGNTLL